MAASNDGGSAATATTATRNVLRSPQGDSVDTPRSYSIRPANTPATPTARCAATSWLDCEYAATATTASSAHDWPSDGLLGLSPSRPALVAAVSCTAPTFSCGSSQCIAASYHWGHANTSSTNRPEQCAPAASDPNNQPAGTACILTFNLFSSLGASHVATRKGRRRPADSGHGAGQLTCFRRRLQSVAT
jgi:hypothetical protein